MAKSQQRKPDPKPQHSTARRTAAANPDFFQNIRLQSWLLFAFAFLLYANTLGHGFVFDDGIVITENMYTQQGIKGIGGILTHDTFFGFFKEAGNEQLVAGGRYRPLSLVLFAIIYQLAGAKPFLFHLATVLLFALSCVVLYRTLLLLLLTPQSQNQHPGSYKVAWLTTAIFAAHPIHTEVVANIKSCDEILAFMGCMAALYFALRAWEERERKWSVAAGVAFFLACLAKENAVAYVALIPLALWFSRPAQPSRGEERQNLWGTSAPIFLGFAAFFVLRGWVLPWSSVIGGNEPMELMNNPFLKFDGSAWVPFAPAEKFATIFYTLGKYIQLLVAPHPLTHDYYPRHIDIMTFGNPLVLLSLAAYGFMGYLVVRGLKQRDMLAFGILLFLLPLGIVSNLIFPVGTNMSERFAFLPSVGFCFVAGLLLNRLFNQNNSLARGLYVAVMVVFSLKTITRNTTWVSNEILFTSDVEVSEKSAKLQNACAQLLVERAKKEPVAAQQQALCQEAITRINRALEIYPDFKAAIILRGAAYAVMQRYPEAITDYRKALALAPDDPARKTMLALNLREAGKYYGQQKKDLANAFKYLNESWETNPKDPETARLLGVANYVQGKQAEAIEWYVKAEAAAPDDAASLWELGLAYGNLGNYDKARELHQRATAIDPAIPQKAAAGLPAER